MKRWKLVAAACALVAGIAMADVTSGNTVGYSEVAAREGFNYYAPQFLGIGASTIDINSIQLDDNGAGDVGWGDPLQIVGPLGNASATYAYWDASMYMGEGTVSGNFWSADGGETIADVTFTAGAGFAIDIAAGIECNITIACPYTL